MPSLRSCAVSAKRPRSTMSIQLCSSRRASQAVCRGTRLCRRQEKCAGVLDPARRSRTVCQEPREPAQAVRRLGPECNWRTEGEWTADRGLHPTGDHDHHPSVLAHPQPRARGIVTDQAFVPWELARFESDKVNGNEPVSRRARSHRAMVDCSVAVGSAICAIDRSRERGYSDAVRTRHELPDAGTREGGARLAAHAYEATAVEATLPDIDTWLDTKPRPTGHLGHIALHGYSDTSANSQGLILADGKVSAGSPASTTKATSSGSRCSSSTPVRWAPLENVSAASPAFQASPRRRRGVHRPALGVSGQRRRENRRSVSSGCLEAARKSEKRCASFVRSHRCATASRRRPISYGIRVCD